MLEQPVLTAIEVCLGPEVLDAEVRVSILTRISRVGGT
jgi:hypothetical protein